MTPMTLGQDAAKRAVEHVCQWVETAGHLEGRKGQRNLSFSLIVDRDGNQEPVLARIQREVQQIIDAAVPEAVKERDAEIARLRVNADFLRASVGECHLMISRNTLDYQLRQDWDSTTLPPRFRTFVAEARREEREKYARIDDWRLDKALEHMDRLRTFARSKDDHAFLDRYTGWLLMVQEILRPPASAPEGTKEK